jgi:hypothetical protein
MAAGGAKTAYIEPGSSWAVTVKQSIRRTNCRSKGYCESFDGRKRDELLNGEIFYSLREAQIIIESWRQLITKKWPHSGLGCRPPIVSMDQRPPMH